MAVFVCRVQERLKAFVQFKGHIPQIQQLLVACRDHQIGSGGRGLYYKSPGCWSVCLWKKYLHLLKSWLESVLSFKYILNIALLHQLLIFTIIRWHSCLAFAASCCLIICFRLRFNVKIWIIKPLTIKLSIKLCTKIQINF